MVKHPQYHTVQMDSVICSVGGKVFLTVHFPNTSFMMAFLRNTNTSQSVIDVFDRLHTILGRETFRKLFPVLLTDRGSEFSNPMAFGKNFKGSSYATLRLHECFRLDTQTAETAIKTGKLIVKGKGGLEREVSINLSIEIAFKKCWR